jgi:predicted TIM-barrel fold metal-dependent hydrolase
VVLDHCLNIQAGPQLDATVAEVVELARHPNLHAKLTFIPTGSAQPYPCSDLNDACRAVIKAYGPDRCIWGSDFPCELWCPKVTYAQHLRIFTHELGLDEPTRAAVLGTTAQRLWFAPRP